MLVDFWAEWCGPCKAIAPALEEIAAEFAGRLTVAKVNIDDNPTTPNNYAVRGIPTLILFKDGQPVEPEGRGGAEERAEAVGGQRAGVAYSKKSRALPWLRQGAETPCTPSV